MDKCKKIPLSRNTNAAMHHDLALNLSVKLYDILRKSSVYSSLISDTTDSAQIFHFVRVITEDFDCFKELLCLETLKDRSRKVYNFENLKDKM